MFHSTYLEWSMFGCKLDTTIIIIAATQAFFLKMCKSCVYCIINVNLLLDNVLCHKPHQWVTPSTHEKEFWFYLNLLWSYSSNKMKHVNFMVVHCVKWRDAMDHNKLFPGAKSFPTVFYMSDFAATIFSCY